MDPLIYLTYVAAILVIGIVLGIVSKRLRISNMLLLIVAGMILKNLTIDGNPIIEFSPNFLISISVLTLVMIVFTGSSKFKLKEVDNYTTLALKTSIIFMVLNMLILPIVVYYIFGIGNALIAMMFAAIMSGTDPGGVIALFKNKSNRTVQLLKFEAIINTPLVVLIPFLLLDILELSENFLSSFIDQLIPFMQQIFTGVGTGIVVGLVMFRGMKKFYMDTLSPIMLITTALVTYILAENIGGNGVLAVTILGVLFGNFMVKEKDTLQGFSYMLSNSLEIFVFVLLGFLVSVPFEIGFIIKSILLFCVMFLVRFLAIVISYYKDKVNIKEEMFISLINTKGIAVAVVAFILSNETLTRVVQSTGEIQKIPFTSIAGAETIIHLSLLVLIYSIILSTFASKFSKYFINIDVQ